MLKICLGFLNDRSIMTTNQNYFIVLLREHNTYSNYQATLILIIFAFTLTICLHKPWNLYLFRLKTNNDNSNILCSLVWWWVRSCFEVIWNGRLYVMWFLRLFWLFIDVVLCWRNKKGFWCFIGQKVVLWYVKMSLM